MRRVVAVTNQKGGVGKTTSVAALGDALATSLAARGGRVLLVDLDPQACLTFALAERVAAPAAPDLTSRDLLLGDAELSQVVQAAGVGLDLVPASIDLASAEADLVGRPDRVHALDRALRAGAAGQDHDVVLLDCSPTLGLVTLNALVAADEVVVPMLCEILAHRAVGQVIDTVEDVRAGANPDLRVTGLLPTMYDPRAAHSRAVLADVGTRYGVPVLAPPVPRSVRAAESAATGVPVTESSPRSGPARAYREIASSLLARWDDEPAT